MRTRTIRERIQWVGAVDWDRRLFDSLIPLPDGTSYNAYLVTGSDKTALIDSVDPTYTEALLANIEGVTKIDYVIAQHAEQDHSGSIPAVLERHPQAQVITTPKGKEILSDLLPIAADKFITVESEQRVSLGDRTLEFIHTPWVHWPETMVTYIPEERFLFTCDFFGSHLATSELYVTDEARVYEAAKRYYAEIMMPFRQVIRRNLDKIAIHDVDVIAPSHGPLYDRPKFILDAYEDWASDTPRNLAVIAYVSTHGSTKRMVDRLVGALAGQGVTVQQFDLASSDIGKLAIALVDAATIVIGTPTIHSGPHPAVMYAAYLVNALRPKAQFAAVIGSYGWNSRAVEQLGAMLSNLKLQMLDPVIARGHPLENTFQAIDNLALKIAENHYTLQLTGSPSVSVL